MTELSDEQKIYVENKLINDTKLIACAGSGKTFCIISRIKYLIEMGIYEPKNILMLTFSRFTRDDFINKVKEINPIDGNKIFDKKNINTIDSFSKKVLDLLNEEQDDKSKNNRSIDVSLLSYKFMLWLKKTPKYKIKLHKVLQDVKTIFIDEAQDLNETQYKILMYLKSKNDVIINMIGDPNQNIYQFRGSSDKYLVDFEAQTFYLTYNFRSYQNIISFSQYLRPFNEINIKCNKDGVGVFMKKPSICLYKDEYELENNLIMIIRGIVNKYNIDYSKIAIIAPTRGKMLDYGKSHGLCLISNILHNNDINFIQLYEESSDIDSLSNITYQPIEKHINILTFMGSKGLQWEHVIIIDPDVQLTNKKRFTEQEHINNRYLLYVACSRAIRGMYVFSRYRQTYDHDFDYSLNPWFDTIPKDLYTIIGTHSQNFYYPKLDFYDLTCDNNITNIINSFDEQHLNLLADICNYDRLSHKITTLYKDHSKYIQSDAFLGTYIENLFIACYNITHSKTKKRYIDIENIINKSQSLIINVSNKTLQWYSNNRDYMTWDKYNESKSKGLINKYVCNEIDTKFNKALKFSEHTIITNTFYTQYISQKINSIRVNYNNYLLTNSYDKMIYIMFNIILLLHSIRTGHYYHLNNKNNDEGKKYKYIITEEPYKNLIQDVIKYASETNINILNTSVGFENDGIIGELDILDNKNKIWEIKCTSDITLKYFLQVLLYNILYHKLNIQLESKSKIKLELNFINLLKGERVLITPYVSKEIIEEIINIFKKY